MSFSGPSLYYFFFLFLPLVLISGLLAFRDSLIYCWKNEQATKNDDKLRKPVSAALVVEVMMSFLVKCSRK